DALRLGRVILRQGRWHADHTVTTCEGETLKPDLDSWAISHIEMGRSSLSGQSLSEVFLNVKEKVLAMKPDIIRLWNFPKEIKAFT
ncbi:DUF1481 domain-containing protein, partial [Salmonella enterica subsp. enterica serovar Montevideo]|nr:DUF1481 domain-containing protein [Salmonella enterica subsp. enterica serovar Montevideo]